MLYTVYSNYLQTLVCQLMVFKVYFFMHDDTFLFDTSSVHLWFDLEIKACNNTMHQCNVGIQLHIFSINQIRYVA
jgi:hypothetical protein